MMEFMDRAIEFMTAYFQIDWFLLFIPFSILIVCGLGVPIPEDILLVFMGYLVYNDYGTIELALVLGYLGIMIGDSIVFVLGKRLGENIIKHRFLSRHLTHARIERAQKFIIDHGRKTIFLARFVPGLRSAIFFSCGTLRMRFLKFFLVDSFAALISAPVFVLCGWYFGDEIDYIVERIKHVDRIVIGVMVLAFAFVYLLKKIRERCAARCGSDAEKR